MMINYRFGTYEETPNGQVFVPQMATKKCDSDAQAELEARNYCRRNGARGIYVRRGDAEWFVTA